MLYSRLTGNDGKLTAGAVIGGEDNIYFLEAVPNDDYSLSITFEDGEKLEFSMLDLLCKFRFSPLGQLIVWRRIEVYPTRLEWNSGTFPVSLNIEEIKKQ
jgi:hypothetical protein